MNLLRILIRLSNKLDPIYRRLDPSRMATRLNLKKIQSRSRVHQDPSFIRSDHGTDLTLDLRQRCKPIGIRKPVI